MKKLTVIVKPANREDVIDIMESCAVYGVMETDITGYGNQKGYRVMYRGTMSGPNVLMKCKLETMLFVPVERTKISRSFLQEWFLLKTHMTGLILES